MEVSDGSADRLQTRLDPVMVPREVPEDVFFKFTDLKRQTLFVEARKLLLLPRVPEAQSCSATLELFAATVVNLVFALLVMHSLCSHLLKNSLTVAWRHLSCDIQFNDL